MNRSKLVWRLMPLLAVFLFMLTGCGDPTLSALDPKGPVAREQLFLMELSLIVMIFVVVVVFAIYLYVIVRFRRRKGEGDKIPKQVEGNHILEIIWTVIPIILLIILAVPTVYYTFKHSTNYTKDANALHVKVTAHQFWWQFEYPDLGVNTAQDLVIPVGKTVAFEVTSADVNHSFWIPTLGGKIDANPGLTNINYLKADEPGVFKGKCAELCGASHALMDFKVRAVPQADFDKWVANLKTPKTVPAEAAAGQELFKANCMACHAVDTNGPGIAPNLAGFANRERIAGILERGRSDDINAPLGKENDENLAKWIHDPQSVKPGAKMPQITEKDGTPLSPDKVAEIVKYLNTLK